MVMDRSQISLGQSLISAIPQVGAQGGVRKHGAGWRRCGNQSLVTSWCHIVTHWPIVTEHGTNARCHGPGWPPLTQNMQRGSGATITSKILLGLVNSAPDNVHKMYCLQQDS